MAIPLIANSAPLTVIMEMDRSDAPLFEIVKVAVPFDPTVTLPNSRDAGVTDSCG